MRAITAAGTAIQRLALNFSFILQFWLRVAAMVVSEINERLSPKNEPQSTTATKNGMLLPVVSASSTAKGVSATTVPTDVPMLSEMKHAAINMLGMMNCEGSTDMVKATVASMEPTPLAKAENAPAKMKIHIIYSTLLLAAPREKISIRCESGTRLMLITPHNDATINANANGIL